MTDEEALRRARDAQQIIDSPLWIEAWDLYRSRLIQVIESCQSDNVEQVMHAKRMLFAGSAARKHLEAVMADGKLAAKDIELKKERGWLSK